MTEASRETQGDAPRLDADALRLLSLVADVGLRRAGLALGVPRTTVSRRLSRVEAQLGAPLFRRAGRRLVVTALGQALLPQATEAVRALDAIERLATEARSSRVRLRVAASPLVAELLLPDVLARLRREQPGIRVELLLSHGLAPVFDRQVDVAIRRGPLADSTSLAARRLGRATLVCVRSPALAAAPLEALPWIRVGPALEPYGLPVFGPGKVRPRTVTPVVAVDDQRAALALVLRGVGAARLSLVLVRALLEEGRLVELGRETRATEDVFALTPRGLSSRDPARLLVERLVDAARTAPLFER